MNEVKSLWTPLSSIHDPYPMYDRLRSEDPVHHSQTGEWILTKYQDVKRVLTDKTFHSGNRYNWFKNVSEYSQQKDSPLNKTTDVLESFILFKNPPEHRVWREIVTNVWPDEKDLENTIRDQVNKLLPVDQKRLDFVQDFARPLACTVIGEVLGISDEKALEISEDGMQMVRVMDLYITIPDVRRIDRAAENLSSFFQNKIESGDVLKDSILSKLIAQDSNELRSENNKKLASLAIFIYIAGLETTTSMMALNMYNLIKNPGHLITLKHKPELISKAIEELTRYDSPVQLLGRIASENTEISGKPISKGDTLTLGIGAANRDPDQFSNPDTIDFRREKIPHLSFGAGAHHCLGDRLAKLEARIMLENILKNFDTFNMIEPPEWDDHLSIRRINNLKIELN